MYSYFSLLLEGPRVVVRRYLTKSVTTTSKYEY